MTGLYTRTKIYILAFCLIGLSSTQLIAQKFTNTDAKFANVHEYEALPGERVVKTWYHYVVSRKGMDFIARVFYPETKALTSYHTYSDRNLNVLNGPFKLLSDDGKAVTKGTYRANQLHGDWSTSTGDVVLLEGRYSMGLREDVWKERYPNGQLKSEVTYVGGEELGPYVIYDTLGATMDRGNSILGDRYTSLPPAEFAKRRGREIIDEFPCFGPCDSNLSRNERIQASGLAVSNYIQKNLQIPQEVNKYKIEGRVNASVTIDEQGRIANISIVNGLCQPISDECRRLLNSMPSWKPGTKNGKPAPVKVLIPFLFSPR